MQVVRLVLITALALTPATEALAARVAKPPKNGPVVLYNVNRKETLALCPLLKPEVVGAALYEPDATDLDVHAIHQGFLRGFRARGGTVVSGAEVRSSWNSRPSPK